MGNAFSRLSHEQRKLVALSAAWFQVMDHTVNPWLLQSVAAGQRSLASTYVNSLVHAAVLFAIAVRKIRAAVGEKPKSDVTAEDDTKPGKGFSIGARNCLAITMGYLLSDLWSIRKQWQTFGSTLLHHAVGISLSWVAMVLVPREYDTHVTPTFLMELSTVMLDAMWLLTAFGRGKSTAHRVFTALFALSFLVTRVIGLPAYLLYIRQHHPAMWASIGTMGKVGCSTLVGLMWFWGWKIFQKFVRPARALALASA